MTTTSRFDLVRRFIESAPSTLTSHGRTGASRSWFMEHYTIAGFMMCIDLHRDEEPNDLPNTPNQTAHFLVWTILDSLDEGRDEIIKMWIRNHPNPGLFDEEEYSIRDRANELVRELEDSSILGENFLRDAAVRIRKMMDRTDANALRFACVMNCGGDIGQIVRISNGIRSLLFRPKDDGLSDKIDEDEMEIGVLGVADEIAPTHVVFTRDHIHVDLAPEVFATSKEMRVIMEYYLQCMTPDRIPTMAEVGGEDRVERSFLRFHIPSWEVAQNIFFPHTTCAAMRRRKMRRVAAMFDVTIDEIRDPGDRIQWKADRDLMEFIKWSPFMISDQEDTRSTLWRDTRVVDIKAMVDGPYDFDTFHQFKGIVNCAIPSFTEPKPREDSSEDEQ